MLTLWAEAQVLASGRKSSFQVNVNSVSKVNKKSLPSSTLPATEGAWVACVHSSDTSGGCVCTGDIKDGETKGFSGQQCLPPVPGG